MLLAIVGQLYQQAMQILAVVMEHHIGELVQTLGGLLFQVQAVGQKHGQLFEGVESHRRNSLRSLSADVCAQSLDAGHTGLGLR